MAEIDKQNILHMKNVSFLNCKGLDLIQGF